MAADSEFLSTLDMPYYADMSMRTRQSTRSYVENESDADGQELQPAETNYHSHHIDVQVSVDHKALQVRTSMDLSAGDSIETFSSIASTASSAYTSSASSSAGGDAASAIFADDDACPDLGSGAPTASTGAPVNFGFVMPGLFRSSYPRPENFVFLQGLGLKTIVTLVDKNYTEEYRDFIDSSNIEHHVFAMKGTKKEDIPLATMESILQVVLDRSNYPLLIHCNQGRHRTGCVVAVLRKIAGWNDMSMTDEYRAYAGHKVRECDIDYIQAFALSSIEKTLASDRLNMEGIHQSEQDWRSCDLPPASRSCRRLCPEFLTDSIYLDDCAVHLDAVKFRNATT
ncbi:tyrosine-protein phosphatase siw14 [Sporothrix epigloea]|uniref:diphosphoinositol-polyphosphate diphosphatase n=1 Tax=Sporothrix epigloea TaxID=1892477 RepID=A0ABP0DDV3_9PEZI